MKSLRILFGIMSALVILAACDDDVSEESGYDDAYYASQATINSNNLEFSATEGGGAINFATEGGEVIIYVNCGTEWTVVNHATDLFGVDWNYEAGTVTVTAWQSTVEDIQGSSITLYTVASRIGFATVTIAQNAYNRPRISVDSSECNVPAVGSLTTEISVDSSIGDFEIRNDCEWLTIGKTDSGVSITADENEDIEWRSAKFTLICDDNINSDSVTISVTQDGRAYVNSSRSEVRLLTQTDSATVSIESNYDWTYSYDSSNDWLTITREGDSLTAVASTNGDRDAREAVVTITAGDGAANVAECRLSFSQFGSKTMIMVFRATPDYTLTVMLPFEDTVDCTVDWGDGSDVEHFTTANPTHTYAEEGDYYVCVDGTVTAINNLHLDFDYRYLLYRVEQWGLTGLTNMAQSFYGCNKLTYVAADTEGALSEVTSFEQGFSGCANLVDGFSEGVFAHCQKVTSFYQVFYNDSKLTTVPANLFANCTSALTFEEAFYNCRALLTVGDGMFANCSSATNFDTMFYWCNAMTTVGEDMFKGCTSADSFSSTFYYCQSLTELPADFLSDCKNVTNFNRTFYYCKALVCESPYNVLTVNGEEVKVHLYERASYPDEFATVADSKYCFSSCNSLTDYRSIPSGWR